MMLDMMPLICYDVIRDIWKIVSGVINITPMPWRHDVKEQDPDLMR